MSATPPNPAPPAAQLAAKLAETPLHGWHAANGGRMVDFAGWSMPVQYGSIIDEHHATRRDVALFDVSHMGRLEFVGAEAAEFLDRVVTRRVLDMAPGQIRYGLVCNDAGGILDDVLVYRLPGDPNLNDDAPTFAMVVNASNRTKIVTHFKQYVPHFAVKLLDVTAKTGMIAVQGPRAIELLDPLVDFELTSLRYYNCRYGQVAGKSCLVSRTGYTGEDGCELICEAAAAEHLWTTLLKSGARPAGLAARDTLRLEAAMPLYGHELSEAINPVQAGLSFALTFADRDFVGRDAILAAKNSGPSKVRVGLQLEGKRAPREGYRVLQGAEEVGVVTSGTFSPTLEYPIAMALVKPTAAAIGAKLAVDLRGTELPAVVTPLPFYQRGAK